VLFLMLSLLLIKSSVSNIRLSTFKSKVHRGSLHSSHVDYWNSTLEALTVQNKFLDIVTLDKTVPCGKDRCTVYLKSNFLSYYEPVETPYRIWFIGI